MIFLFQPLKSFVKDIGQKINNAFKTWAKPAIPPQLLGTLSGWNRSKSELMAENALLRQQLIVVSRQSKLNRLQFTSLNKLLIMVLASKVKAETRLS